MPIYEYQCQACGAEIEALQKVSDAPLLDCTSCGQPALKKKVSAVAFRLKGGGWYETDFKTGGKKNLAGDSGGKSGGEGKTGGEGKSGSEGKSDGAGTAKAETKSAGTGAGAGDSQKSA